MNKVAIFADSTVDLLSEDYQRLKIIVIPLLVEMDGKTYQDGVDITPEEIYASVAKSGRLPATAAVSPERFIESYKPYVDKGYDCVFIGIGSKLSSTVQASIIAASEFPAGRIYTVDSNNLSSGSGLLVMRACRLRDAGMSAQGIYEDLRETSKRVSTQFGIERLDYMAKGGRCSNFAMTAAHMFHIHPILKIIDGKLIVYKKPRGKSTAFYDELLEICKHEHPIEEEDGIMVTSAGIGQEAVDYIVSRLSKLVDPSKIKVTQAGAVISCHCGFGTIGILYIRKKK